jgi:hypothetical protein
LRRQARSFLNEPSSAKPHHRYWIVLALAYDFFPFPQSIPDTINPQIFVVYRCTSIYSRLYNNGNAIALVFAHAPIPSFKGKQRMLHAGRVVLGHGVKDVRYKKIPLLVALWQQTGFI